MSTKPAFKLLAELSYLASLSPNREAPLLSPEAYASLLYLRRLRFSEACLLSGFKRRLARPHRELPSIWQLLISTNLLASTQEGLIFFYNSLALKFINAKAGLLTKEQQLICQLPFPIDLALDYLDLSELFLPHAAQSLCYLLKNLSFQTEEQDFERLRSFAQKKQHSEMPAFLLAHKLYSYGVSFAEITSIIDKRMTANALRNRIRSCYYRHAHGSLSALHRVSHMRRTQPKNCLNNLHQGDFIFLHIAVDAIFLLFADKLANNPHEINLCTLLCFIQHIYSFLQSTQGLPRLSLFKNFNKFANILNLLVQRIATEKEEFLFTSHIPYHLPHYLFPEMALTTKDYLHELMPAEERKKLLEKFRSHFKRAPELNYC